MSTKLYAQCTIKGALTGMIYADQGDEIEVLKDDTDLLLCINLITQQKFYAKRNEIGELQPPRLPAKVPEASNKRKRRP